MIELPMASLVECDQVAGSIDFRERRAVGEAGHVSDMTDVNLQAITASRAYSQTRIGAASETPNLSVERERAKLGAKIAKQAAVELLSAAASAHRPAAGLPAAALRAACANAFAVPVPVPVLVDCSAPTRTEHSPFSPPVRRPREGLLTLMASRAYC